MTETAWDTGAAVAAVGDEVHDDLATQLDILEQLDIDRVDVRSVDGTNVAALDDDTVERVAEAVADREMSVSGIGSPLGKVDIDGGTLETASRAGLGGDAEGFDAQLAVLDRVLEIAARLDADYVRVFSYYIPDGDEPAAHREEVVRRTRLKTERAADAGIPLLHENMPGIYGDTPVRVRDLLTAVDSPYFRCLFEPANFYAAGAAPFPDALLRLAEYVDCVHVRDLAGRGDWKTDDDVTVVPAGEGDLDWEGLLDALHRRGYDGEFSLEPHLDVLSEAPGLSGPDPFERAARAFGTLFEGTPERVASAAAARCGPATQ